MQDGGAAGCRYRLEVQTSDVRRAGTRGSVYVTLIGDAGAIGAGWGQQRQRGLGKGPDAGVAFSSPPLAPSPTLPRLRCPGPYQLSNVEGEHFQRGQLDVFEIEGAPDCGRLQQIEVRGGQGWKGRRAG